jgi:hypothetical protein
MCLYLRFRKDYGIYFNFEESSWPYFRLIRILDLIYGRGCLVVGHTSNCLISVECDFVSFKETLSFPENTASEN